MEVPPHLVDERYDVHGVQPSQATNGSSAGGPPAAPSALYITIVSPLPFVRGVATYGHQA